MSVNPVAGVVPEWTMIDRIRKAREISGLSQEDLAERMGVARKSISNYEVGATTPRRPQLLALAFATGVDLHWLLTGETPAPARPGGGVFFCTPSGTRTRNPLIKGLSANVVPLPRRTVIGDDAA